MVVKSAIINFKTTATVCQRLATGCAVPLAYVKKLGSFSASSVKNFETEVLETALRCLNHQVAYEFYGIIKGLKLILTKDSWDGRTFWFTG